MGCLLRVIRNYHDIASRSVVLGVIFVQIRDNGGSLMRGEDLFLGMRRRVIPLHVNIEIRQLEQPTEVGQTQRGGERLDGVHRDEQPRGRDIEREQHVERAVDASQAHKAVPPGVEQQHVQEVQRDGHEQRDDRDVGAVHDVRRVPHGEVRPHPRDREDEVRRAVRRLLQRGVPPARGRLEHQVLEDAQEQRAEQKGRDEGRVGLCEHGADGRRRGNDGSSEWLTVNRVRLTEDKNGRGQRGRGVGQRCVRCV